MKLAVFDIDGTLFGGNLGIEYLKVLIKEGLFAEEIAKEIFVLYEKYKSGEIEKSVAVDRIYELYALGLKGCQLEEADKCADQTWESIKEDSFNFVIELMDMMRREEYRILLISGSPVEMVERFAEYCGIDKGDFAGGSIGSEGGTYNGEILSYPGSSEQKLETLASWLEDLEEDIDWENSIGMGDNERDIGILTKVGKGYAINPNDKLLELIEGTGITVVNKSNVLNKISE